MALAPRRLAFLALAGLALAAGCSSNNKGKIEGKWKVVALPEKAEAKAKEDFEQMAKLGTFAYFEFKADGDVAFGSGKAGETQELGSVGKYKLGSGDTVDISAVPKEMQKGGGGLFGQKDQARINVKITGDDMDLTQEQGTMKLKRIK